MKSLKDRVKHIDDLRKQAMSDPTFIEMAKEHEREITSSIDSNCSKRNRKCLSEIYSEYEIDSDHKY
ncbi:hypothetical protein VTH8203_03286 [Vibrio thalassae]|uniref:Uncharacterized protein n=1 Tax=Vibrio thalassae TaxID=1243014 RepID=A0A240ELT0_9VIBR|nr:hypothetical protein VTH8203_03286 [Vibrio thalassae]